MNNRWWELNIRSSSAMTPVVLLRLKQFGVKGCAYENHDSHQVLRIFLPLTTVHKDILQLALLIEEDAQQRGHPQPTIGLEQVDTCEMPGNWEPVPVGRRLIVHPADIPYSGDRMPIRLLRRFGFGTTHATT